MACMVTVADCERVQTHWFTTRAAVLGGEVWQDGPLIWIDGPDGLRLMFPKEIPPPELARGLERAAALRRPTVGVWLGLDVQTDALARAGFERGWSPWWMTARAQDVAPADDARIELQEDTLDYDGEHADYRDELALARDRPRHSWYAAAYAGAERRFAGRAWSHLAGQLAGVFDMAVWPPFRRAGLGTALLRTVCTVAAEAGADGFVLNATPEGKLLYERCGFTQIGEGITWWLHRDNLPDNAADNTAGDLAGGPDD